MDDRDFEVFAIGQALASQRAMGSVGLAGLIYSAVQWHEGDALGFALLAALLTVITQTLSMKGLRHPTPGRFAVWTWYAGIVSAVLAFYFLFN